MKAAVSDLPFDQALGEARRTVARFLRFLQLFETGHPAILR